MKSLFLATAAVAALAAAPALAQDSVGSIGTTYKNSEIDAFGLNGESESAIVDAAFAIPVTADWTVTVDGSFGYAFDNEGGGDNSAIDGRVHVSRNFGNVRIGGFAGGAEAGDESLWSFGGEAQAYMDAITLTGSLAYETIEGSDADIWSLGGDAAYYITPRFRVNAGAGYSTVDFDGFDTDGWQANVGTEYQLADSGISLTANYNHSELNDFDLQADTFTVGFRFSFGGDLQTRERSGADLGRSVSSVGSLVGGLLTAPAT
ncbi:outer membrane protein [Brevundimonas sp.]